MPKASGQTELNVGSVEGEAPDICFRCNQRAFDSTIDNQSENANCLGCRLLTSEQRLPDHVARQVRNTLKARTVSPSMRAFPLCSPASSPSKSERLLNEGNSKSSRDSIAHTFCKGGHDWPSFTRPNSFRSRRPSLCPMQRSPRNCGRSRI